MFDNLVEYAKKIKREIVKKTGLPLEEIKEKANYNAIVRDFHTLN
jgi:hypothetical protein